MKNPNRTIKEVAAKSLWAMICCVCCKASENDSDTAYGSVKVQVFQIVRALFSRVAFGLQKPDSILFGKERYVS